MKFAALLMMGVSLGLVCPAAAQTGREGVQSFQQSGDSWRRAEEDNQPPVISQSMIDAIGNSGIANITDSEPSSVIRFRPSRPAIKDIQLTTWPLPVFAALLKTT